MSFNSLAIEDENLIINDLVINSENRTVGSNSSTDFKINIDNPINGRYTMIALKGATIPKTWYNVESPLNSFTITDSVGLKTVVVPRGNYGINDLISAILLVMNGFSIDSYTLTYSNITGKVTFGSSFAGFTLNPSLSALSGFLLYQLGFELGVSYSGLSIESPGVIDISGIKNVYIQIDEVSKFVRNSTNQLYNFRVQIDKLFGDIVFWGDEAGFHQYFNLTGVQISNLRQLSIRLVDEYGRTINNNNRDWSMNLQILTKR